MNNETIQVLRELLVEIKDEIGKYPVTNHPQKEIYRKGRGDGLGVASIIVWDKIREIEDAE